MSVKVDVNVRNDLVASIRELLRGNYNDRLAGMIKDLAQKVIDAESAPVPPPVYVEISDDDAEVITTVLPVVVYNYDFDVKVMNYLRTLYNTLDSLPEQSE